MKKTRQILAIIGIAFLVLLYLSTLFFAITDHTKTMGYFKLSIAGTILVPVLLWAYTMIYKLTRPSDSMDLPDESEESRDPDSEE